MDERSALRRVGAAAPRWSRPCLAVAIPVLCLVHVPIRDRWWPVSTLYYALPLPLIAVAATCYLALSWRRWIHLGLAVAYAALLWGWWATRPAAEIPLRESPDLVYWNVGNGSADAEAIAELIRTRGIPIAVLGEFTGDLQRAVLEGEFAAPLPDRSILPLGGGMAVVFRRGMSLALERSGVVDGAEFHVLRIDGSTIAAVDFDRDPLGDRGPAFAALEEIAAGVDVVCGDFNTPFGSIHFDALREDFACGRDGAEYGRATWPCPLPLLSLDHVFVHRRHRLVGYELGPDSGSDHLPVLVAWERDGGE